MRRWMENSWEFVMVSMLVLAGIAAGVILTVAHYQERARCTDNGGHFVKYNCHEVDSTWCTTNDFGNGSITTTCFPSTSTECDERCVGARAEAP